MTLSYSSWNIFDEFYPHDSCIICIFSDQSFIAKVIESNNVIKTDTIFMGHFIKNLLSMSFGKGQRLTASEISKI